jgi:ribosomal protein L11 methyltransferase
MDPGLAFGTGTHQTTDLCLQYLDEVTLSILQICCKDSLIALSSAPMANNAVTG